MLRMATSISFFVYPWSHFSGHECCWLFSVWSYMPVQYACLICLSNIHAPWPSQYV